MSNRAGVATPRSSAPLATTPRTPRAAYYNVGRRTQAVLGEDDDFLRRRGNTPVVWKKGKPFLTHPHARPERDEGLAAIERNRHGISEETWRKHLAQEALRDFHSSGVDEHLEHLRSAWIDTPSEGSCPWRQPRSIGGSLLPQHWIPASPALVSRVAPEPWARRSASWSGGQQALANGRLDTLANLRGRAVHGDPDYLYSAHADQIPYASGSRPRTPQTPLAERSTILLPVRNHHGKVMDWQFGSQPALGFNASVATPRQPDQWDNWQRRWDRDKQRFDLSGWGKVAQRPQSRAASARSLQASLSSTNLARHASNFQLPGAGKVASNASCTMKTLRTSAWSMKTTAPSSHASSAHGSLASRQKSQGGLSRGGTPRAMSNGVSQRPHSAAAQSKMSAGLSSFKRRQ